MELKDVCKRVVFLDYDGVVNTLQWHFDGDLWQCGFSHPYNNRVNNTQAVQWVSEFCERYGYSIVVTSSWRLSSNYIECLKNGGLRSGVVVAGKTPRAKSGNRGEEISLWLKKHKEVEQYLVFDNECDVGIHKDHLVKCNANYGFGLDEYVEAEWLHDKFSGEEQNPLRVEQEEQRIEVTEALRAERDALIAGQGVGTVDFG